MFTSDGRNKGRSRGHAGVANSGVEVQRLKLVLVTCYLAIHLLILPHGICQILPEPCIIFGTSSNRFNALVTHVILFC